MIYFGPELRVLLVCSANICRSPLAEGMLRQRLRAIGLARKVQVRSAGSRAGLCGRHPDPRVEKLAAEAGFSLGRIRSRILTSAMIRRSDYVLVMEHSHLDDIRQLCVADITSGALPGKVFAGMQCPVNVQLLGSFLPHQGEDVEGVKDIPDPYFGNWQSFREVYRLIDSALTGFMRSIEFHTKNSQGS